MFKYFIFLIPFSIALRNENLNGQLSKLNISEIKKGKHLEIPRELTINGFVEYYVEKGKTNDKKDGPLTIEELFRDSTYTYFGRTSISYLVDFVKVRNNELDSINYREIDGNFLRQEFLNKIVPESDKKMVAKREKGCTSGYYFSDFKYKYIRYSKEIEFTYKWKINCDFVVKIINKTYLARYDLTTRQFKP